MVAIMGVKLLITQDLDPVEAVWIIPVSVAIIVFILNAMLTLNIERHVRSTIDNYNEIRKGIVLTKIESQTEPINIHICNLPHKDMDKEVCKKCKHAYLHVKTEDCDLYGCTHLSKHIGVWKEK